MKIKSGWRSLREEDPGAWEQMRVIEEARSLAEHLATVRMEALNLEATKGAAKGAKANKGRPATAA